MNTAEVSNYGSALGELLTPARTMPLGAGTPNQSVHSKLKGLTTEAMFGQPVGDADMARAAIAGLWLYHDFLDESHEISQSIETPTGSYWHGVMHRREPDYSNAKYWFRRVGEHPVFTSLRGEAVKVGGNQPWDPFHFIDTCEQAARDGGNLERVCREIQMKEWWALFDYSYRAAMGGTT